jgi:hypothetical protein
MQWVPPKAVKSPKPDSKVEKWLGWLEEKIRPEVLTIYWRRHVYRTVADITSSRKPHLPASHFFDYLRDTYAITQAVAVRRQAERSSRVISLGTLLAEVAAEPERMTRERFVSQYDADDQGRGDEAFTEHFGGHVADHLDPALVSADIDRLKVESAKVVRYVNRNFAHLDLDPVRELPLFEDLNAAIDVVGEMFKRYVLLLTASGYAQLVPVAQERWEAVFDEPWNLRADA